MTKKNNKNIGAKPNPLIEAGRDRHETDQGHPHSRTDRLGPDTSTINWDGSNGIDTYEGPNRSRQGDSSLGEMEYEGYEIETRQIDIDSPAAEQEPQDEESRIS
ncbi:MAG: hypothetical protein AAB360_04390 [Patescibacteria group bacterium]